MNEAEAPEPQPVRARPAEADPGPAPLEEHSPSNFAADPMTRLWQDADDRDTGYEAVEALRARRRRDAERSTEKPDAGRRRFRRGRG